MNYLLHKKRATVLALLATVLAVAGMFASARLATAAPCPTMPSDPGNLNVDAGGLAQVVMDQDNIGTANWGIYACTWNPVTDRYIAHMHLANNNPSTPGGTASVGVCSGAAFPCATNVDWTGAEIGTPSIPTNSPGGANGTGAGVATGTGTCTYVNGSSSCPGSVSVADVTIAEGDVVPVVTPSTPTAPPCTGIDNTCLPIGATVKVGQDASNNTVTVNGTAGPRSVDIGPRCVQVNATC